MTTIFNPGENMTKKQKEKKLEALHEWMIRHGYKEDAWGNYKKVRNDGTEIRYKIQKTSIRLESKVIYEATEYSPKSYDWVKVRGAYLKDVSFTEDDKIAGLK